MDTDATKDLNNALREVSRFIMDNFGKPEYKEAVGKALVAVANINEAIETMKKH